MNTHTAEKASKKMCPQTGKNCLAGNCMAWTWADEPPERLEIKHTDQFAVEPGQRPPDVPVTFEFHGYNARTLKLACWREPEGEAWSRWAGYCGIVRRGRG
jgi:hypothetical protein